MEEPDRGLHSFEVSFDWLDRIGSPTSLTVSAWPFRTLRSPAKTSDTFVDNPALCKSKIKSLRTNRSNQAWQRVSRLVQGTAERR